MRCSSPSSKLWKAWQHTLVSASKRPKPVFIQAESGQGIFLSQLNEKALKWAAQLEKTRGCWVAFSLRNQA